MRDVPNGFELKSVATKASKVKYEVEVLQATGAGVDPETRELSPALAAIFAVYEADGKNPQEVIVALWNSGNEQGAKQGAKNDVRKAVEGDEGPEAVERAIAAHQDNARQFIQGAPRGGGRTTHESGLTKAERDKLGAAVGMEFARTGKAPTQARMLEIFKELGINPEKMDSGV